MGNTRLKTILLGALAVVAATLLVALFATPVGDRANAAATPGDVDCDGDVDSLDALRIQRFVADLSVSQEPGCPDIGSPGASIFGDLDCDGDVDSVDAAKILRYVAALPISQTPGCMPIGSPLSPAAGAYELLQTLESAAFDRMLGFSTIPGTEGEAVVVTQGGVIWRVPLGGDPASVFGDLSQLTAINSLLGLAFSPEYQSDGLVYLYYSAWDARRGVLSRFQVVGGTIRVGTEQTLLKVALPFKDHHGGQLAFGPDGYLYMALGDGGPAGDPQGNGQDLSTLLGSILRLDVSGDEYSVPPDNPFVGVPGARPEIYAYGLRNPWRFSFDRTTGDLWAADVGQEGWEEVERIISGGNYGWNVMEGFECFQAAICDMSGLQMPRTVYGHGEGCSVTGGFVYRGPTMPELYGWYVYGDYCSGGIWAVDTAADGQPVLLAVTDLPIVSFGELQGGELVVLTFANAIYRLGRAP